MTWLIIGVILRLEQREQETQMGIDQIKPEAVPVDSKMKGDNDDVKTKYFYKQFC